MCWFTTGLLCNVCVYKDEGDGLGRVVLHREEPLLPPTFVLTAKMRRRCRGQSSLCDVSMCRIIDFSVTRQGGTYRSGHQGKGTLNPPIQGALGELPQQAHLARVVDGSVLNKTLVS